MKPIARFARSLLAVLSLLAVAPPLVAQQAELPLSPEVHPDLRVTFRLLAPEAEAVSVAGEFIEGPSALTKGADGIWSVTLGPLAPEVYEYEFTIEGMAFLDPRNPAVKTNRGPAAVASLLTVRGDEPLFFDVRPVPHGAVEIRTYDSSVTGLSRQVYIYTPPGYDEGSVPLPVLTCCTGGTGRIRAGPRSAEHTRFSTT